MLIPVCGATIHYLKQLYESGFVPPHPDEGNSKSKSEPTNDEVQVVDDKITTLEDYVNAGEHVLVADEVTDEAIVQELQTPDDGNSSDEDDDSFPLLVLCNTRIHVVDTRSTFVI